MSTWAMTNLVRPLVQVLSEIIQGLQLVSIATDFFSQEASQVFSWWIQFLSHFRFLNLDGNYETFLILALVMLFSLPPILCLSSHVFGECLDYFLYDFLTELFFGVMFLPLLSLLLHVFYCESSVLVEAQDIQCWEGKHVVYVVLTSFGLLIFGAGCVHHFISADIAQRNLQSSSIFKVKQHVCHIKAKFCAYRVLLSLTSLRAFSPPDSSRSRLWTATILTLAMIVSSLPIVYLIQIMPYVSLRYNLMRLAIFATSTSVYLVAWIVLVCESQTFSAADLWMPTTLCTVVAVVSTGLARDQMLRRRRKPENVTPAQSVALRLIRSWAACTEEAQGLVIDERPDNATKTTTPRSKVHVMVQHDAAMALLCRRLEEGPSVHRPMICTLECRDGGHDQLTSVAYHHIVRGVGMISILSLYMFL